MSRLAVYLGRRRVGVLAERELGRYGFEYEPDVARQRSGEPVLSISLPARREPFAWEECLPFFEGVLPEGGMREQIASRLKISPSNSYGLLSRIGRDCAGAMVILPEEELLDISTDSVEWLNEDALRTFLDELPRRPLGISGAHTRVRLSLAGLQRKAVLIGGRPSAYGLPTAQHPSTVIVKPQYQDSPGEDIVFNEHFCLYVAERAGLTVAHNRLVEIAGRPCLVVQRFDRTLTADSVVRVHQEDFCQALGIPPGLKYQQEGGPSLRLASELLRGWSVRGGGDTLSLIRATIVNFLLGNGDAHGKNFALLYDDAGPRLAPFYDIVSTAAYGEEFDPTMAMAIGETYNPDEINGGDWLDMSEDCGLSYLQLDRERQRLTKRVVECTEEVAAIARTEGWHRPIIDNIVQYCRRRAQQS